MNRPWHIGLLYGLCVAVLLAAMGWISLTVLRLDRAQSEARHQAIMEEKVRLALWRMDSVAAPLVAQESALPYFYYQAFYAADRLYTSPLLQPQSGEIQFPSPLLLQLPSNVWLHFQFDPDGSLTSPQVPAKAARLLAEGRYCPGAEMDRMAERLDQLRSFLRREVLLERCPIVSTTNVFGNTFVSEVARNSRRLQTRQASQAAQLKATPAQAQEQQQQVMLNNLELQARVQSYGQTALFNSDINRAAMARLQVAEGPAQPIWVGQQLILARRVSIDSRDFLLGCWLDWPNLRRALLASASDLLPRAQLEPLESAPADPRLRLLASLPIRLIPGSLPGNAPGASSAIRMALAVAWGCVLVAAVAVGVLLYGAVSLSERRGAFVSAVTHELRTPLTTFKMYSEMLADGMVVDPEKRRTYLQTLCAEANRLSHLVENVLAYARLERGSARARVETVRMRELLERVKPRLVQRAEQAGLQWIEHAEENSLATLVKVDVSVVEQILFNLVDNAGKYAGPTATEKVLRLEILPAETGSARVIMRVRDHGQGVSSVMAGRLFQPFGKSALEAAHTAPGVGLGLALSRRLSRGLGGDLRWNAGIRPGACFDLYLPATH